MYNRNMLVSQKNKNRNMFDLILMWAVSYVNICFKPTCSPNPKILIIKRNEKQILINSSHQQQHSYSLKSHLQFLSNFSKYSSLISLIDKVC
jgi:hypothetical protein